MADVPINAVCDEVMTLAYLERWRPVLAQIGVGSMKEPERAAKDQRSADA
jgi:hypothetical protein